MSRGCLITSRSLGSLYLKIGFGGCGTTYSLFTNHPYMRFNFKDDFLTISQPHQFLECEDDFKNFENLLSHKDLTISYRLHKLVLL